MQTKRKQELDFKEMLVKIEKTQQRRNQEQGK